MNTTAAAPSRGPIMATWILLILTWILFTAFPIVSGFVGWPLNLVAFILSIVVMAKGNTVTGIILLLCSIIVSALVYWLIGPRIFYALGGVDVLKEYALGGVDVLKGMVD